MKDTRKYWMWLSHACSQGSRIAVSLVRYFDTAEDVYKATTDEIKASGISVEKRIHARLADKDIKEVESILSWCDKNGVTVLTPADERYPDSLLSLRDAPMVLYALGRLDGLNSDFHCAVVGTRKMSDYGKKTAYRLGAELASGGATLVSGLALGIDGMAMAGALEAGGRCIAVLGCGIDVVYPKEHEHLLRKVAEVGTVITEYAPGVSPQRGHFPVRNRIISGLSCAVCVVEGNLSSGSLITARHAIYQGRDLFAVPGPIDTDNAKGTNYLLKQGAKTLTSATDVLGEYQFIYPHVITMNTVPIEKTADEAESELGIGSRNKKKTEKKPKPKKEAKENIKAEPPFPKEETEVKKPAVSVDISSLDENDVKVYDFMQPDVPMLAEELIGCGLPLPQILVSLTMLEVAGAVEAGAGGYYLKRAADCADAPEYITEDDNGL